MRVHFDVPYTSPSVPCQVGMDTKELLWIGLIGEGKLTDPYKSYDQLVKFRENKIVEITDHLYYDLMDIYWQFTQSTEPDDIAYSPIHALRTLGRIIKEYKLQLNVVGWDRLWRVMEDNGRKVVCSSYLNSRGDNGDAAALRPEHTSTTKSGHSGVPVKGRHILYIRPLRLQGPAVLDYPDFWKNWSTKIQDNIVWPLLDRSHLLYFLHHRGYLDYPFQIVEGA